MSRRNVESSGITFKPGEGINIESADHDFSIGFGFRFQLLYTLLDEDPNSVPPQTDQSLQVRRARLQVAGNVFGKHNKYRLELAVSPTDVDMDKTVSTSPLLEAYTEFDYIRDLTLRAGQYKVPYDRIRVTSDMARELVDYSAATKEFSLDRDIGVELKSNDLFGAGLFRYHLGVFSGKGRNSFTPSNLGLLYVARVEVLPFGLFDDYPECDFQRTGPRLSIGGGVARLVGGLKDQGTVGKLPLDVGGKTDFDMATADATFKAYGFSAIGAFYHRTGERHNGSFVDASGNPVLDAKGQPLTKPSPSRDGTGIVAQLGYLLPRTSFEVAGRYVKITGSSDAGHNALKGVNELGGGLNYFFAQHNLKIQSDFFRIYQSEISNGYNQLRLQLQLVM
jgi:phosphate-selective porin OprO/OprP